MNPANRFRLLRCMALLLLLTALLGLTANAEEDTGILTVFLTDSEGNAVEEISTAVYRIAAVDGTPETAFASAGLDADALLDAAQDAKNARTLAAFAIAHQCDGMTDRTDAAGEVRYSLREGIYLVRCEEGQHVVFPSFLVRLPLKLNGKDYYEVDAFPKAEPAPGPTPEPSTEPGNRPNLPQTGWDPLPTLVMAAAGVLLLALGSAELLRSRGDRK